MEPCGTVLVRFDCGKLLSFSTRVTILCAQQQLPDYIRWEWTSSSSWNALAIASSMKFTVTSARARSREKNSWTSMMELHQHPRSGIPCYRLNQLTSTYIPLMVAALCYAFAGYSVATLSNCGFHVTSYKNGSLATLIGSGMGLLALEWVAEAGMQGGTGSRSLNWCTKCG